MARERRDWCCCPPRKAQYAAPLSTASRVIPWSNWRIWVKLDIRNRVILALRHHRELAAGGRECQNSFGDEPFNLDHAPGRLAEGITAVYLALYVFDDCNILRLRITHPAVFAKGNSPVNRGPGPGWRLQKLRERVVVAEASRWIFRVF